MSGYALSREVAMSCADAEARVRAALGEEGFGVLTEIDVRDILRRKIDIDVPAYRILGACAPRFAHQAILAEPDIGLLLPCNVVVRDIGEGRTVIAALDPVRQLALTDNPAIEPLAAEVRAKLERVIERAAAV